MKTSARADNGAAAQNLVIPPGQFGLILTNEVVTIPNDLIGFISIKAKIKFRGLINVSGFHVDPGFHGHGIFTLGTGDAGAILGGLAFL